MLNRRLLMSFASILLAATGCGNGVPGLDDGGSGGGTCTTNADCSGTEVCVSQVCTPISDGDAGTPDGGPGDGGQGDGGCTTDTWSNFAESLIVAQCISCHDHSHNFVDSYSSVKANRTTMQRDVSSGAMPRSPQSLTTSERTRLVKWFSCGAPQ